MMRKTFKLLTPIKINGLEIRNRVVMPAFGLKFTGLDRKPNDRLIAFYEERAKGGCGLIIVGGVGIDLGGSGLMLPSIENDDFIADWARMAGAIHKHGAKLFLQLFHAGRYQHSLMAKGKQPIAPSAVPSRYTKETPREMTLDDIVEVQEKFAAAAVRARTAGADGVEIIASAGYLICQFLSPITNHRCDEYGGSFENRCRFGQEVLRKVRAAVGDDFPMTVRVSGNEFMPGGNTNLEIVRACKLFQGSGADAINVTGGWHETKVPQLPSMVPPGAFTYLAAAIRKEVSVPAMASNRITNPVLADRLLRDGVADLVCIGRALIADPNWVAKTQRGEPEMIRPCVACMQGCLDRLFKVQDVQCLCNPRAGLELKRTVTPAAERKTVAVVGTGPAGLEAAVTASQRGHRVLLFDRGADIGGQLKLVAAPPGREEFMRLLEYYRAQVLRLDLPVRLCQEATVATLKKVQADFVVVATGSTQTVPNIPGIDRDSVVLAWDVLLDHVEVGERVAILGGGAVGVETAIAVAERGAIDGETLKFLLKHEAEDAQTLRRLATTGTHKVTIIEMTSKLGRDIGHTTRWVFLKELDMLGVDALISARVVEITDSGVRYETDGQVHSLAVDSVVLALGATPESGLVPELEAAGIPYTVVGDARKPRNILDAIHEGFKAALDI